MMHCTLGDWTSLVEWVAADGKAQDLGAPEWQDVLYRAQHAEHLFDVLDQWAAGLRARRIARTRAAAPAVREPCAAGGAVRR